MGKGSDNTCTSSEMNNESTNNEDQVKSFTWEEISKHKDRNDCWIVIDNQVYDVTKFQRTHPGGSRLLRFYAGQDASEVSKAFHKEFDRVDRLMKVYRKGIVANEKSNDESNSQDKRLNLMKDFEQVRKTAIEMGLFNPSYFFYFLQAFHIIFLQFLGFYILWNYGSSFWPFICAATCHIITQVQSGWSHHDFGHSSILAKPKYNKYFFLFYLGVMKGASAEWWSFMHNQHHGKPNVISQDPDVRLDPVFVVGKVQPVKRAEKNVKRKQKNLYPFDYQHYLFPLAAALLYPAFFQFMTVRFALIKRKYKDLVSIIPYYLVNYVLIINMLGWSQGLMYIYLIKLADSTWFTWVSQCNHIVMDIHEDDPQDTWLSLQLKATCNINKSWFNDWFTGHLNFQIEHHLFPTMPRHNLYKVQPLIQSLCKKYNVRYVVKPLGQAFLDIISSLKKSGELWREAYEELEGGM